MSYKVTEPWGKLTDKDFDVVAGRRDPLAGKRQRHRQADALVP